MNRIAPNEWMQVTEVGKLAPRIQVGSADRGT